MGRAISGVRVKTSFQCNGDVHLDLRRAALRRGVSVSSLVEQAVIALVDDLRTPPPPDITRALMWLYLERRAQLQAAGSHKLIDLLDEGVQEGHAEWRDALP